MKAIGIDIGTTTISGVVVEVDERRHSTVIEAKTIQNGSCIFIINGTSLFFLVVLIKMLYKIWKYHFLNLNLMRIKK